MVGVFYVKLGNGVLAEFTRMMVIWGFLLVDAVRFVGLGIRLECALRSESLVPLRIVSPRSVCWTRLRHNPAG